VSIWNVVVPVIANLEAPDGPAATARLERALEAVGFTVYTDARPGDRFESFEAESDTEADELPLKDLSNPAIGAWLSL
jgi:hypothetical protein